MNARVIILAPALLSVFTAGKYVGCVLARGPRGFEAFDRIDASVGTFASPDAAAEALAGAHRWGAR